MSARVCLRDICFVKVKTTCVVYTVCYCITNPGDCSSCTMPHQMSFPLTIIANFVGTKKTTLHSLPQPNPALNVPYCFIITHRRDCFGNSHVCRVEETDEQPILLRTCWEFAWQGTSEEWISLATVWFVQRLSARRFHFTLHSSSGRLVHLGEGLHLPQSSELFHLAPAEP